MGVESPRGFPPARRPRPACWPGPSAAARTAGRRGLSFRRSQSTLGGSLGDGAAPEQGGLGSRGAPGVRRGVGIRKGRQNWVGGRQAGKLLPAGRDPRRLTVRPGGRRGGLAVPFAHAPPPAAPPPRGPPVLFPFGPRSGGLRHPAWLRALCADRGRGSGSEPCPTPTGPLQREAALVSDALSLTSLCPSCRGLLLLGSRHCWARGGGGGGVSST